MLKKLLSGFAVAASVLASVPASAAPLLNWSVDTDGIGGNAPVTVGDYLDLTGTAFIRNTFTSATTFTFNEAGRFAVRSADTFTELSPILTATFLGTGSGTTGGMLTFDAGGILKAFSGSTEIGEFRLQQGTAQLLANSTLPNGTISLIFEALTLTAGYWYDSAMNDLSVTDDVLLGFATTNSIPATIGSSVPGTLLSLYNENYTPIGGSVVNDGFRDLVVSNNGQFRLDVQAVPEPSILGLFGIGFLGLTFLSRRRKNS